MLPATSPLTSTKFIFRTTRANVATSSNGITVTQPPASDPLNAGGAEYCCKELRSCAQADRSEEEGNAKFTEREVRVDGHVPHLPADVPDSSEDQRHKQRSPSQTEPDGMRKAGKGNGQRAKGNAKSDADEEGNEMGLVQFLERIAHRLRGLLQIILPADQLYLISELKIAIPARRTFRGPPASLA